MSKKSSNYSVEIGAIVNSNFTIDASRITINGQEVTADDTGDDE